MAELIVTDLHKSLEKAVRKTAVPKQRGRDSNGQTRMLYRLEASSDHFDLAFTKAFTLSVAKARKSQKKPAAKKTVTSAAR